MKTLVTAALLFGAMSWNSVLDAAADIVIRFDNPDKVVLTNRLAVQRIFTRKDTRWSDGSEIKVFIKPINSIEHSNFLISVLGISTFSYKRHLESQTYAGRTTSVMEVDSDEIMALKISQIPGSIGYINYAIIINNRDIVVISGDDIR